MHLVCTHFWQISLKRCLGFPWGDWDVNRSGWVSHLCFVLLLRASHTEKHHYRAVEPPKQFRMCETGQDSASQSQRTFCYLWRWIWENLNGHRYMATGKWPKNDRQKASRSFSHFFACFRLFFDTPNCARKQDRVRYICHMNHFSVSPVTDLPGRVPGRKCLCSAHNRYLSIWPLATRSGDPPPSPKQSPVLTATRKDSLSLSRVTPHTLHVATHHWFALPRGRLQALCW